MNKRTDLPAIQKLQQQTQAKNENISIVRNNSHKRQITHETANLTCSNIEPSNRFKKINVSMNFNGSKVTSKRDQLSQIIDDPPTTDFSINGETCSTRFGRSAQASNFWKTCYKPEINEELFQPNNFCKSKGNRRYASSEDNYDKQLRLTGPEKLWNLFILTEEKKIKTKSVISQSSLVADSQEYPQNRSISKSTPKKKKVENLQNITKTAEISKTLWNSAKKNPPLTSKTSPKKHNNFRLCLLSKTFHQSPEDSFHGKNKNQSQIQSFNCNNCITSTRKHLDSQQSTVFCKEDELFNRSSQLRNSGLFDSISDEMNQAHEKLQNQFKEHKKRKNVDLILTPNDREYQKKCENYHSYSDNCKKANNQSRISDNQSVYIGVDGLMKDIDKSDIEVADNINTSKINQNWILFKGRILDLLRIEENTKINNVLPKYNSIKDIIDSARKTSNQIKLDNYWKRIMQIFNENNDKSHGDSVQENENIQEYLDREQLISYLGTINQVIKSRSKSHKRKKQQQSLFESKQQKIAIVDQQLKDYFQRLKQLNCSKSVCTK